MKLCSDLRGDGKFSEIGFRFWREQCEFCFPGNVTFVKTEPEGACADTDEGEADNTIAHRRGAHTRRAVLMGKIRFVCDLVVPSLQPHGREPKGTKRDKENDNTCGIMPAFHCGRRIVSCDQNESGGPDPVEKNCGEDAQPEEDQARHETKTIVFAKKELDHKSGLERANAAASFVDTNKPSSDFDDGTVSKRGDTDPVHNFGNDQGVDATEAAGNE